MNDDKREPIKESPNGIVETKFYDFDALTLESGEMLSPVKLAYETYGSLNEAKDNAILLCHALSGDAHAAGYHTGDKKPGWWEFIIGPGRAFDTNKYFVVCSNVIGSCNGSTGPASINPKTGKKYGMDFPAVSIRDMVNAQAKLMDYLGIDRLFSVAGGSMGGMQVLEWAYSYPGRVKTAIPIATTFRHSAQQIAFNVLGRIAIQDDPAWNKGEYSESEAARLRPLAGLQPASGLGLARMIGHITYMSDEAMERKFGREVRKFDSSGKPIDSVFEVESFLRHQGETFVKRFDANAYLCITKALDNFNLGSNQELIEHFTGSKTKFLVISYSHDWIYPAKQSKEIVRVLKFSLANVSYIEITQDYGHDAFLIEHDEQGVLVGNFLENVRRGE